jgi:hypothetical protein
MGKDMISSYRKGRQRLQIGHPVPDPFDTSRGIVALILLVVAFAPHRIRRIIRRRHAF